MIYKHSGLWIVFIKRLNKQKQCVWELIRKFGILASLYSDERISTGVSLNKPVETKTANPAHENYTLNLQIYQNPCYNVVVQVFFCIFRKFFNSVVWFSKI